MNFTSSKGEFHTGADGQLTGLGTAGGAEARFGAHGITTFRAPGGLTIHYAANGARRVETARPDGSRIVSTGQSSGFVEHTFSRGGRIYVNRTYMIHGQLRARVYSRYLYRGAYFYRYVPQRFYAPAFYGWAYNPWVASVYWNWGWGAAPWLQYSYYYFAPYRFYTSPALWLTDYLLAADLQAAYEASGSASSSNIPRQSSPGSNLTANVPPFERKKELFDGVKMRRAKAFGVLAA